MELEALTIEQTETPPKAAPQTAPEPAIDPGELEPGIDKSPVEVGWRRTERQRQILFVDDDDTFLALCERRFAGTDYGIKIAQSADVALKVMEHDTIDVVVSDLCMPGTGGAELMREVERRHPDIVRIIVSGKLDIAETIDAINKGHIHHYVVKPFNDKDLKLTLYQALLVRERAEAEQRRQQERQLNVKRRARELGEMLMRTKNDLKFAYDEAIDALGALADPEGECNVVEVAGFLARKIGLDETASRQLEVAARLRNVAAVHSDGGADDTLAPAESARIVGKLKPFSEAAKTISCHCERFDGSGSPLGLVGEEIPVGARIIGLAEDYDAHRHAGLSHCDAVDELAQREGRYDPQLLSVLSDVADLDASLDQSM